MQKNYLRIPAAILIVSIGLFLLLLFRSRHVAPPTGIETAVPIVVEIKGEAKRPGIYTFEPDGATVSLAASAAGLPDGIPADIQSRRLVSGESLESRHTDNGVEIHFGRMPAAALLACGLRLDLNFSTVDDLLLVPGMRPEIAESIVKRRREKQWESVENLSEIRGVGKKTAEKLKEYLEVRVDR